MYCTTTILCRLSVIHRNSVCQSATLCPQIICWCWCIFWSRDLRHLEASGAKRREEEAAAGQTGRQRGKCEGACRERKAAGETTGSQRGGPFQRIRGGRRLRYLLFGQNKKKSEKCRGQRGSRQPLSLFSKQRRWLLLSAASLFDITVVDKFSCLNTSFVSASQNVSGPVQLKQNSGPLACLIWFVRVVVKVVN